MDTNNRAFHGLVGGAGGEGVFLLLRLRDLFYHGHGLTFGVLALLSVDECHLLYRRFLVRWPNLQIEIEPTVYNGLELGFLSHLTLIIPLLDHAHIVSELGGGFGIVGFFLGDEKV